MKIAKEFKEFITRGNVMNLAVGIIIGGAFTAIVNSLVGDIVMPLVGVILGGIDFSALACKVGEASITYGNFIQAIINFLIISLVVFSIVKVINKVHKEKEKAPAEPSDEVKLLTEIRDSLANK